MKVSNKIKGVRLKKQWAVFGPDGNLHYGTIADTKKKAKERVVYYISAPTWDDYAAAGYTTNKILVDIKLL